MKTYIEILENENITIEEVKAVVAEVTEKAKDDKNFTFDFSKVEKALKRINERNKKEFTTHFCYSIKADRKSAFSELLNAPSFDVYTLAEKKGVYSVKDGKRLFSFADLEKGFQTFAEQKDAKGNIIRNNSITIFDALRFYGLTATFIRNLQKVNFEIDTENAYHLENVVIDSAKAFDEKDGEVFASNSNNALEKQLNILVTFFGYDVKMLKKDLPVLKIKAQKIKQDRENAKFSVNAIIDDSAILKFADAIFGVVASRIKGEDIAIITQKPAKAE